MSGTKEDLQELQELLGQSKRVLVRSFLEKQIRTVQQQIEEEEKRVQLQAKKAEELLRQQQMEIEGSQVDPLKFLPISNYSFDQSGNKVSIYISLEGIGELSKENISIEFKDQAFDLKILNFKGVNYHFTVPKLCEQIVPAESKMIIKANRITLSLTKKKNNTWSQLHFKEDKSKDLPKPGKDDDPQASIMNLMKKMYDEGDDEMKRTLNKAWAESREKNGMNL